MSQEIEITMENNKLHEKRVVPVLFKYGSLAVTKYQCLKPRAYVVTHIPTRYYIKPYILNKKTAIKFLKELSDLYDWEKIRSREQAIRLHALKKKIAKLRKRLKLKEEK